MSETSRKPQELTTGGRWLIVVAAFLGWLFAGSQMGITTLAMRSAATDLTGGAEKAVVDMWFSAYVCAFLLGAATGGFVLGWIGDRFGRTRAMGISILTYSIVSGLTYWVESPSQLLVARFIACMGIGGMWPNGVALVSEAWSKLSRPVVAGIFGTSANFGILLIARIGKEWPIVPTDWRWIMLVVATPAVLGVLVLLFVPESSLWRAARRKTKTEETSRVSIAEVFRPPLRKITLIGIALGTIPLLGGWGSANWVMAWAEHVDPEGFLKADLQQARSVGSIVGALLGGVVAMSIGRRLTFFIISAGSLVASQLLFWFLEPNEPTFYWVFGTWGLFNGLYFGWLPFCLPELFPTRVRSTGAGVSFNWGRILSAVTVLITGAMMSVLTFAEAGRITSLIFLVGMIVICFAPDTTKTRIED
jgi:hypothetical protein